MQHLVATLLVLPAVPEPPATVDADSPNSTSINITWTPPNITNGILLHYEVRYSLTAGDCSSGDVSSTTSVSNVALSLSTMIYGLKKYQYYCVFVRAFTSAGPGQYSSTRVRTDPDSEWSHVLNEGIDPLVPVCWVSLLH